MMFTRKKSLILADKDELRSLMQLKCQDEQLLQMLFASHILPEEKMAFFNDLDIEKEPMEFNLMLAHLCSRHGYQNIPAALMPRIRGVARFYLFKNATLFSSFRRLGKTLNQASIPLMLLKGAAIKANYDLNSSRCLVDIDFAVPKERLHDVVKIAQNQGYHLIQNALHAVNMKQCEIHGAGGSIDIHHCLFKTSNKRSFHEELADGAKLIQFFGTEVWVPSSENLLLHLLENEFYNLYSISSHRRHFKWIYDSGLILSSSLQFDWIRLANTARKYGIYAAIQPMLFLLADYLPQYVPKAMLVDHFPLQHSKRMSEMEKLVSINLDRRLRCAQREKLSFSGKHWKSLFLWPSFIVAEYRMLRYNGKVNSFFGFMLHHCKAKNFREVIAWFLFKLRTWNYWKKPEVKSYGSK